MAGRFRGEPPEGEGIKRETSDCLPCHCLSSQCRANFSLDCAFQAVTVCSIHCYAPGFYHERSPVQAAGDPSNTAEK